MAAEMGGFLIRPAGCRGASGDGLGGRLAAGDGPATDADSWQAFSQQTDEMAGNDFDTVLLLTTIASLLLSTQQKVNAVITRTTKKAHSAPGTLSL